MAFAKRGKENESKMYKFVNLFDEVLMMDEYISKKVYKDIQNQAKEEYDKLSLMEQEKVLFNWCRSNKYDYKNIVSYLIKYKDAENLIKDHNEKYIKRHLKEDKEYLDKILEKDDPRIMLDDEQRNVVLSDEDYTLVVAGAGAGKTTTIEAKAKYLVDKKGVDPIRILVVSFTRKATAELKDRFKKIGVPAEIATFHSIGNTLIKNDSEIRHQIVNPGFMFDSIREYLTKQLDDEYFIKKVLLFFAVYLNIPFNENDVTLLFKELSQDVSTVKEDIKEKLDTFNEKQIRNRVTINEERVRSIDECRIANFLYINGIDYVYEPVYRYGFKDTIKPYCPDFMITQGDKVIYLEHFGISDEGENSRYNNEEIETYKRHIRDKIVLHKKHGTKLIYTFSKYKDGRDVLTHLKELLERENIKLDTKDDMTIYRKIAKNAEDKYFNKLIQLVCTFISRFKVNNYTLSKFDEWKISLNDERTRLFIEICYKCYLAYESALKNASAIDFEDMINDASNLLDGYVKCNKKLPYDYIFVDEYQDISLQRFNLCERLSKASDAKIIAVGDDWQSIYRFSGSKINLFTKFEEIMGYANILKITNTYRNSQELIDIAGNFVMENNEQIKKNLKSEKSIKEPVILMSYDDSYDKEKNDSPFHRLGEAIEKTLDMIVATSGMKGSVLLIGRYGFDGKNLFSLTDIFECGHMGQLRSIKYPGLNLTFLTAHSSKGLGFDNVIVINGKDDILGFPSKIEDDPVMKLVIKDEEKMDFSEERRLFYVALTRTKNRVFIITPQFKPSSFVLEIKEHFSNVILKGAELNPQKEEYHRVKCPVCGYPLQKRQNRNINVGNRLWVCSNDPELCGFVTNDLKGGIMSICKCPDCEDGFLIVKQMKTSVSGTDRMLGCTNYKKDGTGCNGRMFLREYTQNKDAISIQHKDEFALDKVTYCGNNIKELIDNTIAIIEDSKKTQCNMSPKTLTDVLLGQRTKVVESFKLFNLDGYGIVSLEYSKKVWNIVRSLERLGYISIDKENYNLISIKKTIKSNDEYEDLFYDMID